MRVSYMFDVFRFTLRVRKLLSDHIRYGEVMCL
jgi:hypothetical protein